MLPIHSLIPDDNKYSTYEPIDNGYAVTFYNNNIAVARRDIIGKSLVYIEDVQVNWLLDVLTIEQFTVEERLRA